MNIFLTFKTLKHSEIMNDIKNITPEIATFLTANLFPTSVKVGGKTQKVAIPKGINLSDLRGVSC